MIKITKKQESVKYEVILEIGGADAEALMDDHNSVIIIFTPNQLIKLRSKLNKLDIK